MLHACGAELLLVGRDVARINAIFPDFAACSYDEVTSHAVGFDLFVHMAAINSDSTAPVQTYFDVNVDLALAAAASSKAAGVGRFVYISSTHALDGSNTGPYAASKREGARRLTEAYGDYALIVHLPAVYGEQWAGRLAQLNRLPKPVAKPLFSVVAALKPTLSTSRLVQFLLHVAGTPLERDIILSDGQQNNPVYRAVRRTIDLGAALVIAVFFWWALALVWIAIRLESAGPGIFAQQRIGRNGAIFTCYKFRTMKLGTVQAATNLVSSQAVTRMGQFLRKSKIDELPQILNIFRNQISLIGPRPCLPVQKELIAARSARAVLALKPGITGLAQVNGIDMSDPQRLAVWDARYAALQCLALDIKILLATVLGKGGGDRVAQDRVPSAQ